MSRGSGLEPHKYPPPPASVQQPEEPLSGWEREIDCSFSDVDGIAYASSMARHAPAFTLFEPAKEALLTRPGFN